MRLGRGGGRILVTGVAGFIGSHVAERLLADGCEVVGVDDFLNGGAANLGAFAREPRFTLLERDVVRPLPVDGPLSWVMHFAGPSSRAQQRRHPLETLRVNGEGCGHLLELARRHGAQFFLASSSEIYGECGDGPVAEARCGAINPNAMGALGAEAKRYAEAMTTAWYRSHALPVRIARIFDTYGPRMDWEDGRVLSELLSQARAGRPLMVHGDGQIPRSFQYIDDLVEAVVRLMRVPYFGPVNLANPTLTRAVEAAHLVAEVTGTLAPVRHQPSGVEPPPPRPDVGLAQRLLGEMTHLPLREGLLHTWHAQVGDSIPPAAIWPGASSIRPLAISGA